MSSIGSASLLLSTNGSKLKAGLDQAKQDVQGFASSANSIFSSIGGGAVFAGIAAGIGTAIASITSGFQRLQDIGKQTREATALGVDPSQFQGISLILQRVGMDASQTGDFFGNLNSKLERAARTGMGPVAAALGRMHVDLDELMALPADERFMRLADAFKEVGPSAQASAAAMSIFGSTALLPQLQRGREGLQGFIDEAKRSGEILTGDQNRLAMEASKAWTEASRSIKRAWDSVSTQVALAITPIVKMAADIFKQVADVATPIIRSIGEVFGLVVEIATPLIQMLVETIKGAFSFIGEFFAEFGVKMPTLREAAISVFEALGVVSSWVFDTLKAGLGAVIWYWGVWVQNIGWAVDKLNLMRGVITHFEDFGKRMRQWGSDAVTSFGNSQDAVLRFFNMLRHKRKEAEQQAAVPLRPSMPLGPDMTPAGYSPVKPLLEGSADLYSYQMQWKADPNSIGNDPKELQREANKELRAIRRNTERNGNPDALELAD